MLVELSLTKVYMEKNCSTPSLLLTDGLVCSQEVCCLELQFHLLSYLWLCPNFPLCQDINHWTRANLNDFILILLMSSAVSDFKQGRTFEGTKDHSSTHESSFCPDLQKYLPLVIRNSHLPYTGTRKHLILSEREDTIQSSNGLSVWYGSSMW